VVNAAKFYLQKRQAEKSNQFQTIGFGYFDFKQSDGNNNLCRNDEQLRTTARACCTTSGFVKKKS